LSEDLLSGRNVAERGTLEEPTDRPAFIDRYHEFVGREPSAWWLTAAELKRAAEAVREQWHRDLHRPTSGSVRTPLPPNLGPGYMLVAAFAIENLTKGILIWTGADAFPSQASLVMRSENTRPGRAVQPARRRLDRRRADTGAPTGRIRMAGGRDPVPSLAKNLLG